MPKKAVDYSKTVIYKLVCNNLEVKDLYVGHTTGFTKRKNNHKTDCNNEKGNRYNLKVYKTIRENGGWDNYSMIEIEKYPCKDGNEALARERYWYEQLEAKLNTYSPTLNVEKQNEKQKIYNAEHREEKNEKRKKYEAEHREERKEYKKEHYAEHREERKEYQKIYNAEHREKRNQQARERYAKKKAENILISSV